MEREVREVFLNLQEIFQIEYFVQCTCTIEVRHLTVGSMQRLGQVHDLCTQRSHTGTTTYPHHLFLRIEDRMEVSVRTTHNYLITGFQRKDVRRSDTRIYVNKARTLIFRFERRRSNTYCQHDAVTLSRIVSHGICTNCFFFIRTFQAEQTKVFPCRQIFVTNQALINILVIIH